MLQIQDFQQQETNTVEYEESEIYTAQIHTLTEDHWCPVLGTPIPWQNATQKQVTELLQKLPSQNSSHYTRY